MCQQFILSLADYFQLLLTFSGTNKNRIFEQAGNIAVNISAYNDLRAFTTVSLEQSAAIEASIYRN